MPKQLKLTKKKEKEIISFLTTRFSELDRQKEQFNPEVNEEIDIYNDVDKNMQPYNETTKKGKHWWETNDTIPYVYTIVQTMVARIIQIFFGRQNYLRIFIEDRDYKSVEKDVQKWLQYELDKIHFKRRARDFIEEALVQRMVWLQLRPVFNGPKGESKLDRVEFNVLSFFDVWFDTRQRNVMDSDYFVRNIIPLWKIKNNQEYYMNVEKIEHTSFPEYEETEKVQEFEAKHSSDGKKDVAYYNTTVNDVTDEVELMSYYGVFDLGKEKDKPDFQHVIFTLANREVLVRAEKIELETTRKYLLFPVRPMRQANSLIGKSPAQVTKGLQYLLNEAFSQTLHNFKLSVNLMFKYKRDAEIDMAELFALPGNAIGWEDAKDNVDLFPIPNLVEAGLTVVSWIIQFMQQTTGAVDYVMGTSAARGITETASGINTITQQAMFKFQMMAENIQGDLNDIVTYIMILWIKYNPEEILRKFPELDEFVNQTDRDLEEGRVFDIAMNDLALRRDTERTQFLNGINIIAGMVEKVGGDMLVLLRETMEKIGMDNVDQILKNAGQGGGLPGNLQEVLTEALKGAAGGGAPGSEEAAANQKRGGSNKANPQAENAATPDEEASNTTPKTGEAQ
jgi:hypothetical protein